MLNTSFRVRKCNSENKPFVQYKILYEYFSPLSRQMILADLWLNGHNYYTNYKLEQIIATEFFHKSLSSFSAFNL